MWLLWTALACSAPEPLQRRELAGFSVALPAWAEAERSEDGRTGRLELESTEGVVVVDWSPGAPVEEPMLAALSASGGLEVVEAVDSEAAVATSRTLVVEGGGRTGAMTAWLCAGTVVGGTLSTFVPWRRGRLLALHHQVLASMACGAEPQTAEAVFPRFTPPDGYERIDHPSALVFGGPLGDVFDLSRDAPLPDLPATLASTRGLAEAMAQAELSLAEVEPAGERRQERAQDGRERDVWTFGALRGGDDASAAQPLRVIVTAWSCGTTAHVAMHAGDPGLPEEPVLTALLSAACPD